MNPVVQRVLAAFGAHSFGQAINIFIQLASLPLFLTHWDLATYGVWLILAAIPSYLSMADGGLVTAAANKLSIEYAKGHQQAAARTFQSALAFLLVATLLVMSVLAVLVWFVEIPGLSDSSRQFAVLCLAMGVLLGQFNGLAESIFRAANQHAKGIMLGNLSRLLEFSGWMVGLFAIGTFEAVAVGGLLMRIAGFTLTAIWSSRLGTGVTWGFMLATKQEIRSLVKPAASFMAFPMANALSIQGVTLMVGYLLGPVSVTIFNAYRTISRVALQVTGTLGNSLWAEFARLYATGGGQAVAPVYRRSFKIGAAAAIAVAVVLALTSPYLLAWWSRGKISYEATLMLLMLSYAAVGGLWNIPRVLMMSINKHTQLAIHAMLGAIATLVISYFMGTHFGLTGFGASVLLVEIALASVCILLATRLVRSL